MLLPTFPHIPLLVALLLALPAHAQIYQYKDAAGRTVFSDRPAPPGAQTTKTFATGEADGAAEDTTSAPMERVTSVPAKGAAGAPTESAPAQDTPAGREAGFRQRQEERRKAADEAQQAAAEKARLADDCARARNQLRMLESGERIALRNERGERVFLDDVERAAEAAELRKAIAEVCK